MVSGAVAARGCCTNWAATPGWWHRAGPGESGPGATAHQQRDILTAAFTGLADDIIGLHAKDVTEAGYAAAGYGLLDYELIFSLRATLPVPSR